VRLPTLRLALAAATVSLIAGLVPVTPATAVAGFGDVAAGRFYTSAVQWLVDEGITTGTSPGCFSPERAVTRGEVATFVWRAEGRPAAGTEPFTDVAPDDFFADAVAWMAAEGITTGTTRTTFEPDRGVTRGEVATFLWRAEGRPAAGTEPFTDVAPDDFFADAVAWMATGGITTGTTRTTFEPDRGVTRGEVATFLWRTEGAPPVTVAPGGSCGAGSSPAAPSAPAPPTAGGSPSGGRFATLPPGAALPSGAACATRVTASPEIRPGNAAANSTVGTRANGRYPRVDGNFTGSTDEIIQWAACKWGIDADIARAQLVKESWWHQSTGGDRTWDQSACHPQLRTASGTQCPESTGLLQVRYLYHLEAFEDANAIRSTAYNADYTWAMWRSCYDGKETWLNTVERGATYGPGDMWGCLGVWFSGRWRTQPALDYIAAVQDYLNQRIWAQSWF
jgi:hypothetical protein